MADNFLPAFDMDQQRLLDKKVENQILKIKQDLKEDKNYISPVTDKELFTRSI